MERDIADLEQTLKLIHAAMLEPETAYDADQLSNLQTQQNEIQQELDSFV